MKDTLDILIQTQKLNPALNLAHNPGSIYQVNLDVSNNLGEGEISLSRNSSKAVLKRLQELSGKGPNELNNIPTRDINELLERYEINVLVSRSPVPHVGGVYMARVTSLHNRDTLADINPVNVFRDLEGDGDGDTVHVELLDPSIEPIYKNYLDNLNRKGLNLRKYELPNSVNRERFDLSDASKRHNLVLNLTSGKRAIGEIANVQALYGVMSNVYHSFVIRDEFVGSVRIKNMDDKIEKFQLGAGKDVNYFSGTVSDFLRTWLQAAVDNSKFNYMYDWGYSATWGVTNELGEKQYYSGRDRIIMSLFELSDGSPLPVSVYKQYIKPIVDKHKEPGRIRRGYDFEKGNLRFSEVVKMSKSYDEFTQNRAKAISDGTLHIEGKVGIAYNIETIFKDSELSALEEIVVSPSRVLERKQAQYGLSGMVDVPTNLHEFVHRHAHNQALMEIDKRKESIYDKAFNLDVSKGLVKPENKKAWIEQQYTNGLRYSAKMTKALYNMIISNKKLGAQSFDRNDQAIDFKEKYAEEFKNLSNVAKMWATQDFLEGHQEIRDKNETITANWRRMFPPTSDKVTEPTLLEPGYVKDYFTEYNKTVTNEEVVQAYMKKGELIGTPVFKGLPQIINRICK